jgi:preprotein translocase subunit SecG
MLAVAISIQIVCVVGYLVLLLLRRKKRNQPTESVSTKY